jgi:hypothetical protein
MLASDLNNTEFAGARNPNDLLHVEFYDHAALDDWKTRETGIKSYKAECPFIRIAIPGNPNLTVERPADGRDMQEYPRQWLVFQMQTGKIANAENVPGWQLETWDEVTPEQARQLKFLRFYTVEQIAGANDAQIQGVGMGGEGLRQKAKRALAERNGAAVSEEVKARDAKIAALEAKLEKLITLIETAPDAADEQAPAKRGRPAKQPETM